MNDLREKLAEIVSTETSARIAQDEIDILNGHEVADAIIAAMPGMVQPLEWENFDAWTWWAHTPIATYLVNERSGQWTAQRKQRVNGERFLYQMENTEEAAKAAAQNHHTNTILAAVGVQGGET